MDKAKAQQFMQKVVGDVGTAMASALVLVGVRVGLFRAMAGAGPMSAAQLAQRSQVGERHLAEWLAAMAGAGYLVYHPQTDAFELPAEHALYLANPAAETFLGGLFEGLPPLMGMAPRLASAFQRGDGISFAEFGASLPVALEQMNRVVYENRLVQAWLPHLPQTVARLAAGGRAVDVGCGTGVVPILLAKAYPDATIEGIDRDARSIEIARGYAEQQGVADRVRFINDGAQALGADGAYDLVTTFDVIHDLPDPVGVLSRIRTSLAPEGVFLMVEPAVEDRLQDNLANPFARLLYAISCLHCVPQSLAQGGPGLGACWGPARARALAEEAGFRGFERLPVRSPVMAFYALRA